MIEGVEDADEAREKVPLEVGVGLGVGQGDKARGDAPAVPIPSSMLVLRLPAW